MAYVLLLPSRCIIFDNSLQAQAHNSRAEMSSIFAVAHARPRRAADLPRALTLACSIARAGPSAGGRRTRRRSRGRTGAAARGRGRCNRSKETQKLATMAVCYLLGVLYSFEKDLWKVLTRLSLGTRLEVAYKAAAFTAAEFAASTTGSKAAWSMVGRTACSAGAPPPPPERSSPAASAPAPSSPHNCWVDGTTDRASEHAATHEAAAADA
jgi:hypothetical protein